ncbi:PREDICTED: beta-galactosidase 15-like [Camelina sativa]|uniref:Beta-galactosidase 15-like n=1 Tax=Camelina sativa TaxID=90675 RepID=A0ABM0YPM5_CAMSA|nr:PREDICTED: beta-galactosidase 15-like [Camelina sativa]
MDILHCRHHYGLICLLVLLHSSLYGLASKIDVSYNERGSRTDGNQKHVACTNQEPDPGPLTRISCNEPGYVMTKINFADYGNPTGTCVRFRHGNCRAAATMRIVKKNCLGKAKCQLLVTDEMFGPSHCKGAPMLAVQTTCTKA